MPSVPWFTAVFGLLLVLVSLGAQGQEPDPGSLYELSTEGSSKTVTAGGAGKLVISIRTKGGAHISDETPLKVEISGTGVKPEKQKLSYADSITAKSGLARYPDPRFEVPFAAGAAGKGSLDAKLTFFVCTEKVCARQQKSIHLPVEVK
jgi:hypothetical protein